MGYSTFNYKYDVGDTVLDFKILEQIKYKKTNKKLKKGYSYTKGYHGICLKCGISYEKDESQISRGRGCGVCSNRVCIRGVNDIATTHPYLVKYFVDVEDAYTHTSRSGIKIKTICPECNTKKDMLISNLTKRGYSCVCMKGGSFPNKVITSMLSQLNIEYECEKTFNWAFVRDSKYTSINGIKFYDHYLPSFNCIIENHGRQHYEYTRRGRELEEEQENDRIKRSLAKENNISKYVELDCRTSDIDYIKNSVMSSILPNLLSFKEEDVDWDLCYEFATRSTIKEVCDLWNNGVRNTLNISERTNIHQSNISKYLKIGESLGLCNYDARKSLRESVARNGINNAKPVDMYQAGKFIGRFSSAKEIEIKSVDMFGKKFYRESIKRCCRGERAEYNGYSFVYCENDYENTTQ